MKTTTKNLGNGLWDVKRGGLAWTGRATNAKDARNKARDMWSLMGR